MEKHDKHDKHDSVEDGDVDIDPVAEKQLVRKLDLNIVPFVIGLYLFSFLDRVNIGNARLYSMEADLGLVGDQFQIGTSILFVTYVLSEVPSNLVLKKFRPSRWLAFIATSWGIIATLTGITQNYAGFLVCRLLLGAVEGGLFPGMLVYLTLFYTRKELALRICYLFVSSALAGAVGGLLAYGIGHMDGVAGQKGWRWILIIEGLPTVILGIATAFALADSPETAWYLNDKEKKMMVIRRNRQAANTTSAQEFHWSDVRKAGTDWRVWAFCFIQFGADTMLYGFSTFLPTIIQGLGQWTTSEIQALTIPCYVLGAVTYLVVARISDSQGRRGLYAVIFEGISVIGYGLLISNSSAGVHYFGCYVVAIGLYVGVGIPLTWLPNNSPRYGKRTMAAGMQLTIGNTSGIMAPFLYPTAEGPRYIRGHAVTLALVGFSMVANAFMWWSYSRANQRRRNGLEDYKIQNMSENEIAELGDESPRFVYTI